MNVFDGLKKYGESSWEVTNSRTFAPEELAMVDKAEVVSSDYGSSVCFFMKSGGKTYIPLSRDSTLTVGDTVDMAKAKLLTLHREGDGDINRIDI